MTCETLKDLVSQYKKESEWIEFKVNNKEPYMIGEYISALANSAALHDVSKAYLIYGVEDETLKFLGTDFKPKIAKKGNEELENWLHRLLEPSIEFVIYDIECEELSFSVFEIESAAHRPISFEGKEYVRVGSYKKKLKDYPEKERKLWAKLTSNALQDWSANICEEATIDDLSEEAIAKARELYTQKNPKLADDIPTWDDKTFLNKAKITIKDKITNTAILLLGKSESEYMLSPAIAKISWILKDKDNVSQDYEHFYCPFILSIDKVYEKIRNLKYRYMRGDTIFPEEVDSYHPFLIRESLNNAIAHQDYMLGGKINVVEFEDRKLVLSNNGSFIPQSIENVLSSDAPETKYRNKFLAQAMINLNLIDTIGSGIMKMFKIQSAKYFPLPEYKLDNETVQVKIEGKVLDINYASKLASIPDLSFEEIFLLDKVQKGHELTAQEAKVLKAKELIEGKRPNIHISSNVAKYTSQEDDYIKLRGIDDEYAKKIMLDYLKEFKRAKKSDFVKVLLPKLPDVLDDEKKKNKIKNYLQDLRTELKIKNEGKYWVLV